jgi:hypothetical protein
MAEHSITLGYQIKQQNTAIPPKTRQMDQILRKATGIELHLNNINREDCSP